METGICPYFFENGISHRNGTNKPKGNGKPKGLDKNRPGIEI